MLEAIGNKFTVGDGCWIWHGGTTRRENGYGRFKLNGKKYTAHRFLYELLVGPIPPGHELDHLCRVTRCVRPSHLEPVTHAENVRRGNEARRAA